MKSVLNKTNDKSNISQTFKLHAKTKTTNSKDIANHFCDFFTNVGPTYANAIPKSKNTFQSYMKNRSSQTLFLSPTDANEIKKTIYSSLKSKHSCGHDNVSPSFLKQISHEISYPISILINKSIESGEVPDVMKIAKVVPIYKSKDKEEFSNYRPISLLPTLSKILEKIIHKRLYFYFQTNTLFYGSQFGFRKQHSTIHAVTEFVTHTIEALENKTATLSVFLDLSKAFDTIDHNIMLKKLEFYGIRGIALNWFESYLTGRKQFVQFNNEKSILEDIICSVPQGSVLGPLLFIIYTNDIPNCIKSSCVIVFADDTTIYASGSNMTTLYNTMKIELESLTDWFCANKLSLNVSKTNYMVFGNHNITANQNNILSIGNTHIQRKSVAKFLGVLIDDQLNWFDHIKHVKSKMSSSLYCMNSAKNILTKNELIILYYSLLYPYLDYGIVLWGSAGRNYINRLATLQKKAVRTIVRANYNDHTAPIYKALNLIKIDDMYKLQLGKFMYQVNNNNLPLPIMSLFTSNAEVHDHFPRQRNNLHFRHRRTAHANKSVTYMGPTVWQDIPQIIKLKPSLKSFSNAYKKYLVANDSN